MAKNLGKVLVFEGSHLLLLTLASSHLWHIFSLNIFDLISQGFLRYIYILRRWSSSSSHNCSLALIGPPCTPFSAPRRQFRLGSFFLYIMHHICVVWWPPPCLNGSWGRYFIKSTALAFLTRFPLRSMCTPCFIPQGSGRHTYKQPCMAKYVATMRHEGGKGHTRI